MSAVSAVEFGLPPTVLARLRALFAAWPQIDAVWLYGSRAKGNFRPGSDIDLMVQAPGMALVERLRLETAIDALDLPWSVDLALEHEIENPALRAHIARVGREFYRRDVAASSA